MKTTVIALAATMLLTGSLSAAHAACSPEEAQTKANAFAQAIQAKGQADPAGYATIMQDLQPQLVQLQQKQDMDALCAFYDEALNKLK